MQGCLCAGERYFLLKVSCCILINSKYKGMWFTFILQRQPIWISVNPRRWGFEEENDWDWFTCCVSHAAKMPIRWRVALPLLKYRRHRSYLKHLLHPGIQCHKRICRDFSAPCTHNVRVNGSTIIIIIVIIIIMHPWWQTAEQVKCLLSKKKKKKH